MLTTVIKTKRVLFPKAGNKLGTRIITIKKFIGIPYQITVEYNVFSFDLTLLFFMNVNTKGLRKAPKI